MQQQPQNRLNGSLRRGNQCSGPRDAMAMVAPHRHPRLDTRNTAALIRRPVSHARGGVFSFFCAESTGTSAFAALPVAACSDQLGAGAFFARHVTIAGRSAGGIVSGFESCGARLSFARRVAGQPSTVLGSAVAGGARGAGRRWLLSVGTRSGHSHSHAGSSSGGAGTRKARSACRSTLCVLLTHARFAQCIAQDPDSPFPHPLALDAAGLGRGARIFFAGVEEDRSVDNHDIVMSTVHRLQRELHQKHDDPRWQTWPGEAAVEARCAVAPKPVDAIDYDAVCEIAETADADLDAMEYLEPCEARDLCRELLRLRQIHGGAQ